MRVAQVEGGKRTDMLDERPATRQKPLTDAGHLQNWGEHAGLIALTSGRVIQGWTKATTDPPAAASPFSPEEPSRWPQPADG